MKHLGGPPADDMMQKGLATDQGSPPMSTETDVASTHRGSGAASTFSPAPLRSPLPPDAVVDRVSKRSKAGKLAGYMLQSPATAQGAAFRVLAFGGIYDHEMVCAVTPADGGGSSIKFHLRVLRKMPIIAAVMILVTIFPGLPLTHSMLTLYFDWYTIQTWWWYLPMVMLMLPMMWKQFKSAQREARQHAQETIGKLRAELDAA